jgi:hypothetical protein
LACERKGPDVSSGRRAPSDKGDVRIWPHRSVGRDWVRILLQGTEESTLLELPSESVQDWLLQTLLAVTQGVEGSLISWDAILERLLSNR